MQMSPNDNTKIPPHTLQVKNQHELDWLANPVPVVTIFFTRLLKFKKKNIKRETECCSPISVYLKTLWKINWGWSQRKKSPQIPRVNYCQTASISYSSSSCEVPGEAPQQSLNHIKYFITSVIIFFLLFDIFQTFYWQKCHQVTVRLRLAFLLLKAVTAVVKMPQNAQNLNAEARYLPRLGALAVLLLFFILKKPRPKEDLALRVPKVSSSPAPPWEEDLGGRVEKLLPSTGGLTCLG